MIDYQSIIEHIHNDLSKRKSYGEVASYIPELAMVDAEKFGVCLTTVDGNVYIPATGKPNFQFKVLSRFCS